MLLLLIATQASAVDAERAFAADAQKLGQWTAFRRWATDDAVMFWPQPVKAQEKLKTLPDPPRSVEWRPAQSFVSCDGMLAANTGPWRQPNGSVGYFSTIWVKQPEDGWKWTVDGGDAVKTPRFTWDAEPQVRKAACDRKPIPFRFIPTAGESSDDGISPDKTLAWNWSVAGDGSRRFNVALWNGREWEAVIKDAIAASPTLTP